MEAYRNVSLMLMYEDESVDVRYADGSRLQLSPCGCEFVMEKAQGSSAHPLHTAERVRQRTQFTISSYKELLLGALVFRNKYATQPYLPDELIPAALKQCFVSVDSGVEWPDWSSCAADPGPSGDTMVRSVEGRASLTLSSSGKDFSVAYTCSLSQDPSRHRRTQSLSRERDGGRDDQRQQTSNQTPCTATDNCTPTRGDEAKQVGVKGTRKEDACRAQSCSPPQNDRHGTVQLKPEKMFQATTVVQHFSCSGVAPTWCYPLALAQHHWAQRHAKPSGDDGQEGENSHTNGEVNTCSEERRSHLPEALPLRCSSPHQHRWKYTDLLAQGEQLSAQDLPTELVKIMWCQGVTYRILGGAVPVVEIAPGDGSVIRSNGVLNSYFTHHTTNPCSGEVKEITYHLNNLPPDVPAQMYSVASIVNRASRVLTCYNQARHSLNRPATPSCLVKETHSFEPKLSEEKDSFESGPIIVAQAAESRSFLVAAELEKIKRFNFLLENSHLLGAKKSPAELGCSSAKQEPHDELMDASCISAALQRTCKAIQDIDTLLSSTTLTPHSST